MLSKFNFNPQLGFACEYQDLSYVSKMSEAYLEPAQVFKMVLYGGKVNGMKLLVLLWQKAPP